MDKELTPKQQTSEAIRQAEAILIMTGQRPTIDQVASAIALTAILRKYGKKVTTVISDDVPSSARFLPTQSIDRQMGGLRDFIIQVDLGSAEVDKLKYTIDNGKLNVHITPFAGGFSQRDVNYAYGDYQFDLVIILGVASYNRIDRAYAQNADTLKDIPLVNIDFHRINEQYGAVNLIEGNAASLAEILIALSESLQTGLIDEAIATTMLTGLYAATDRFTATHTTAKAMTVAAQMVAMGADQQRVVKNLYRSDRDRDAKPARVDRRPADQTRSEQPKPEQPRIDQSRASSQRNESARESTINTERQPERSTEGAPRIAAQSDVAPQPTADVPSQDPQPAGHTLSSELPASASTPPQAPPQSVSTSAGMEALLPPQHIELSPAESPVSFSSQQQPAVPTQPEPLINDETPRQVAPARTKPANPTNNPIFAQRLDDFEY